MMEYRHDQHRDGPGEYLPDSQSQQCAYGLAILTNAANMHSTGMRTATMRTATTTSQQQQQQSDGSTIPKADGQQRKRPTPVVDELQQPMMITNRKKNHDNDGEHEDGDTLKNFTVPEVSRSSSDYWNTYPSSLPPLTSASQNMGTLAFNSIPDETRQDPYTGWLASPHDASTFNSNGLGILNAESYDDGRFAMMRADRAAAQQKAQRQREAVMPFGITNTKEVRAELEMAQMKMMESEEFERGPKRKSKRRKEKMEEEEDDEEARKKARGRPRVDPKDETAADRRRTQIRMAQRAYRHRKETTITSLEKQVQDLRGTNEEMSKIFITLYDFAVGKGLLHREPEFGQQLQSTTERFLALAKSAATDEESHEENQVGESSKSAEPEPARKTKARRSTQKKVPNESPQSLESTPNVEPTPNPWGGYTMTKEESPIEELRQADYETQFGERELQIITRPTEDNASFPFDMLDLQQYRVEVPSIEDFSQHFPPFLQPAPVESLAYSEFSLARRIHRSCLERGFCLISAAHPPQKRFHEVFGLRLLYESKEDIQAQYKMLLQSSAKETLHNWRAPFVHVGGAGTFYPMHEPEVNDEYMPKFRSGFSMGPFSPSVSKAQDFMQDDMRCTLPGFEGEFFDANDVEGYLRGRGLHIPAHADYVRAEIDLSALGSPTSSSSGETVATEQFPKTPQSPTSMLPSDAMLPYNPDFSKPEGKDFPFPTTFDWNYNDSSIDPSLGGGTITDSNETSAPMVEPQKHSVTFNVKTFLDTLLGNCVCLGRTPGFRAKDINAAIIAAIKAGF